MKALFVLSIVVPMGLLTAFRLTGVLPGLPTIAETITAEPVTWKVERINELGGYIDERSQVSYQDDDLSSYVEFKLGGHSPTCFLGLQNLTISAQKGFVKNIVIVFRERYNDSRMILFVPRMLDGAYTNLRLYDSIYVNNYEQNAIQNDTKAILTLASVENPQKVAVFKGPQMMWGLNSQYNRTHELEITTQIVYFNGTVYKELVHSLTLNLAPDRNNSFEDAEELNLGIHKAYIDGNADPVDCYKIWLQQGQKVDISLAYPTGYSISSDRGIEMRVYNPNRQIVSSLLYRQNGTLTQVTADINLEGWWYIQIDFNDYPYTYFLSIAGQT